MVTGNCAISELSAHRYSDLYIYAWHVNPLLGYATRFQAPAGKQDFLADAMTSRNSIGIRFLRNMLRWRHTATGVGEYYVTFAFPRVTQYSSQLAGCCSDACTIESFIRGTGMSKKAIVK
jgi:hypothetical protein